MLVNRLSQHAPRGAAPGQGPQRMLTVSFKASPRQDLFAIHSRKTSVGEFTDGKPSLTRASEDHPQTESVRSRKRAGREIFEAFRLCRRTRRTATRSLPSVNKLDLFNALRQMMPRGIAIGRCVTLAAQ